MNWYKKANKNISIEDIIKRLSSKYYLFGGNCGSLAIALGKYAQKKGSKVVLVLVTDNVEVTMHSEFSLYHVGVEIDGILYDGDGKTTEESLAQVSLDEYGNPNPQLSFFDFNNASIDLVRRNTNFNVTYNTFVSQIEDMEKDNELV
jgi:hypothetical protein